MRPNALFARGCPARHGRLPGIPRAWAWRAAGARGGEHREKMPFVILACSVLLALAIGYEIYTAGYPAGGLIEFVQAQPLPRKLAWAVIVVALLAAALWESARLEQQRKANQVWETRFRAVRKSTDEFEDSQKDLDRATN